MECPSPLSATSSRGSSSVTTSSPSKGYFATIVCVRSAPQGTEALKHAASNVRFLLPDAHFVCLFVLKFSQESYDLKEKIFALKDAFEAHNDLQLLQRAGMNQIRSTLTHLTLASKKRMFDMDAKQLLTIHLAD